ncbi:hypothetical protein UlMin_013083 [Ulmus minor]
MTITIEKPTSLCHVLALPYPGRGHVNPMMNICKQLVSRKGDIIITFVVTEEWLGLIESEPEPDNIRFATVPNVIPSEHGRAKDFPGFIEAVNTKLEAPFEKLLDRLEPPVSAIVADTYMVWAVGVGNRRNIPVASLWTMSATVLTVFRHFDLLGQNRHFPIQFSEQGHEVVDYIPGVPPTRIADLPAVFYGVAQQVFHRVLEATSNLSKAQYLLSTSVYELEHKVFDVLSAELPFPVYPIGPSIPHFSPDQTPSATPKTPNYLKWLDAQPKASVLYISLGSFLSVSTAQLDEIVEGVRGSGTRFLWVARSDSSKFKDGFGDVGLVVPWCDQLRVLCHPSIGGFWTHCGWNSTLEAVFSGVPLLTFPIFFDQIPNSKQIVEDWKIGYRVKEEVGGEHLVTRDEIAELVKRLMDVGSSEWKATRKRAEELREACRGAVAKGGSSDANIDAFIRGISHGQRL